MIRNKNVALHIAFALIGIGACNAYASAEVDGVAVGSVTNRFFTAGKVDPDKVMPGTDDFSMSLWGPMSESECSELAIGSADSACGAINEIANAFRDGEIKFRCGVGAIFFRLASVVEALDVQCNDDEYILDATIAATENFFDACTCDGDTIYDVVDLLYGFYDVLGTLGASLSNEHIESIRERIVLASLSAIDKFAGDDMSLKGVGDLLVGLSDVLATLGASVSNEYRESISERILIASLSAIDNSAGDGMSIGGAVEVLVGLSDVLATLGCSLSDGIRCFLAGKTVDVSLSAIEKYADDGKRLEGAGEVLSGISKVMDALGVSLSAEIIHSIVYAVSAVIESCSGDGDKIAGVASLIQAQRLFLNARGDSLSDGDRVELFERLECAVMPVLVAIVRDEKCPSAYSEIQCGMRDLGQEMLESSPLRYVELSASCWSHSIAKMVPAGRAFASCPAPVDGGKVFAGWFVKDDMAVQVVADTIVTNDMKCVAKWVDAPVVENDPDATVNGNLLDVIVIVPGDGMTNVVISLPEGVPPYKVTVQISSDVASVSPGGSSIRVVNGGADITSYLDIPDEVDGVVDMRQAKVKEELVSEIIDEEAGAVIKLNADNPEITTAPTRVGLTYVFCEGTSVDNMIQTSQKTGDGTPWSPSVTVKGGSSGFYSIGVVK